ncbi:HpcH/HpaI aldolase/citrate lyase family protein [Phytoactinopolyspora halotolerans]|uniref:CoA ester lyase n=1 Tax=Phytoactinopolyspora halotolerans TaxID=1981512 RepID=A0A6L9S7A4_9ACTN|nr:CoA ester lyase [Phytoactinopolyspora halotolerans]NEE00949.1 CoA ester lyase [Phytoactinopolyspora halotolerans]
MSIVLTQLYVPGDRPDRARKALSGDADVVILDLEDAVAAPHKESARAGIGALIDEYPQRPVQVRVNAPGTSWGRDDLAMVAGLPPHVEVRLPMVTSPDDVAVAVGVVGERPVHALLETASGIEAAAAIARAPGVASLGLGEADLASDLGVTDDAALMWCRQRVVVAARAAGLPAPAAAVYTNVHDLDGLAESTRQARRWGFVGRAAIHPRQLPIIEAAFAPDPDEVERAREVIASVDGAQARGDGTSVLPDGSFLDLAMVEQARHVLALDERTRTRTRQ